MHKKIRTLSNHSFKNVYTNYRSFVLKICSEYVQDEDVQDVASEIWCVVWRYYSTCHTNFHSWLQSVVRTRCLMWLRAQKSFKNGKNKIRDHFNSTKKPDNSKGLNSWGGGLYCVSGDDSISLRRASELLSSIQTCRLTEIQRKAIMLKLKGNNTTEIARSLGLTTSAAKSLLNRARTKVKTKVEKDDLEGRKDA